MPVRATELQKTVIAPDEKSSVALVPDAVRPEKEPDPGGALTMMADAGVADAPIPPATTIASTAGFMTLRI